LALVRPHRIPPNRFYSRATPEQIARFPVSTRNEKRSLFSVLHRTCAFIAGHAHSSATTLITLQSKGEYAFDIFFILLDCDKNGPYLENAAENGTNKTARNFHDYKMIDFSPI